MDLPKRHVGLHAVLFSLGNPSLRCLLAILANSVGDSIRAFGAVASRFALVRVALRAGIAGGRQFTHLAAHALLVRDALEELAD